MGKTTTIAKMRPDGSVVEVMTDGSERPISGTPMRPMTPEEVEQAARADPDARPMTAEQLAKARRIPRIKTLRRALGLTQEEFAARYKIPLGHPAGRARRSAGGAFEPAGLCRAGGDALPHRRTEEVVRFEGDYRPRQVDSADVVAPDAGDPRGGWQNLLSNDDVAVAISRRRKAMPYCYRDMEGDLLYFVHRGRGVFATEFRPGLIRAGRLGAAA
jgi:putative transcriptional regulator